MDIRENHQWDMIPIMPSQDPSWVSKLQTR
jgi:hypothetical protein